MRISDWSSDVCSSDLLISSMRNAVLFIVVASFLTACAARPDPLVIVYVGSIERDCSKITNARQLVAIPIGLKLTPVEAARSLRTCQSKFGYSVYADNSYYYFLNNDRVFLRSVDHEIVLQESIVVDGNTGDISGSGRYGLKVPKSN